ncbi:MAG: YdcF family protein [Candidatus Paceibacterota bacterium]|jgi:hypothetical protein
MSVKIKKYVCLLGGGLAKDGNGMWRTTLGENEGDMKGFSNDRLRVLTAAALWKENNELKIIVSGGQGQYKNILPVEITLASVMKKELLELGVPADNIMEEDKSNSTYEQLCALSDMINSGKIAGKVEILSNEWHLPRVEAMIKYTGFKTKLNGRNIKTISAEDILLKVDGKKWKDFIDKMRKNESLKKRVAMEKNAIEQIKNGTYNFVFCLDNKNKI